MHPTAGNISGLRAETLASGAPVPRSEGWPPRWAATQPAGMRTSSFPPGGWPSVDQLDYTTKAITALLLVLALPALLTLLVTKPERALAGLGRRHLG